MADSILVDDTEELFWVDVPDVATERAVKAVKLRRTGGRRRYRVTRIVDAVIAESVASGDPILWTE